MTRYIAARSSGVISVSAHEYPSSKDRSLAGSSAGSCRSREGLEVVAHYSTSSVGNRSSIRGPMLSTISKLRSQKAFSVWLRLKYAADRDESVAAA